VPVKSIGAVVQGPLNIVLSLEEEKITTAGDLVGKTIGYAGTELSEALIRSIMQYVGADYSDVTMIDMGFDLMSSMTTGNVDATIGCLVNHEVPLLRLRCRSCLLTRMKRISLCPKRWNARAWKSCSP